MSLNSMTGLSRSSGTKPPYHWTWELKAVNAKGLDLRLRLPPGFEALEPEVRARIARRLSRGSCQATLAAQRESGATQVRIDADAVAAVKAALSAIDVSGFAPLSLDGLLSIRGVVEIVDRADEDREGVEAAFLTGLDEALGVLDRDVLYAADALLFVKRRFG